MDIEYLKNLPHKQKEELKRKLVLRPLKSKEELRAWIYLFLDILFPMGTVYPTSTHGPIDAMWRIYQLIATGESAECPEVVMLSSRDSYKCQVEGSKVLTKNGLLNIEKVSVGDELWSGRNWQKVTDWIDDGYKDGIRLILSNGAELTSTPIHKYWILRDGMEMWCEVNNLQENDLICYNTNTPLSKGFEIDKEEFDNGYFLGILAGDGSVSSINSPAHAHIAITTVDPYIKEWFHDYCEKKFNCNVIQSKHDPITYCIWDKKTLHKIKEMGVNPQRSWEKSVPTYCYRNNSAMIGFVSGLFDTDGTFDSRSAIDFPITAGKMLKELQAVFSSWGISSKYRCNSKKYGKQNHKIHHLVINSNEIHKLYKIGFTNNTYKANSYVKSKRYDAHDTLPIPHIQFFLEHCGDNNPQIRNRKYIKPKVSPRRSAKTKNYEGITYDKLNGLLMWLRENNEHGLAGEGAEKIIDRMSNILNNKWLPYKKEKVDSARFYDLTVEEDHSYWSNGSISHNTLGAAAIEALCLTHFQFSVAHAAAVLSQSEKAVQYNADFFKKLKPYLEHHGWKKTSDSKTKIEWLLPEGRTIYLRVLVMTPKGMNSEHLPALFLDEIDLVQDPRALEEAKMVPSVYKQYFPLTVSLSTRKYKGGLMEKKIKEVKQSGGEILRWNILDVCERITKEEAKVNEPKIERYISRELPMENLTPDEWENLPEENQVNYEKFLAYAGIAEHPLLSVMRNYLVDRPQEDVGNLYKPVIAVRNNFKQTSPDMGEAQLLCNKPSSSGLVYPRFDEDKNILSISEALTRLKGEECDINNFAYLQQYLISLGVPIIGGADWGFTDHTALGILAMLPSGEIWLLDNMSMPGLELDDIVKYAIEFQNTWDVDKWYVDQAYPAYIKTLKKNGLKIPKFTKDVAAGIAALQGKVVDSSNIRKFYIIDTPNNKPVIDAFGEYRWSLDGKGEIIEGKPYHDKDGVSDIMDMLRYPFQNLYSRLSKMIVTSTDNDKLFSAQKVVDNTKTRKEIIKEVNQELMRGKIGELSKGTSGVIKVRKKGRIMWG